MFELGVAEISRVAFGLELFIPTPPCYAYTKNGNNNNDICKNILIILFIKTHFTCYCICCILISFVKSKPVGILIFWYVVGSPVVEFVPAT